jgi:hypothetical protein
MDKRSSALHGGLHGVEIHLLRGGDCLPMPLESPDQGTAHGDLAKGSGE